MKELYRSLEVSVSSRARLLAELDEGKCDEGIWREWKDSHSIEFGPGKMEEERIRFALFCKKFAWVEARNEELAAKNASYRVGANVLSALTEEELDSLTGKLESVQAFEFEGKSRKLRSKKRPRHHVEGSGIGPLGYDGLPQSVDWRVYGAVTTIKSQGSCGACWAFSATGALEGLMFIENGQLISLSENQLLECDNDPFQRSCEGGNHFFSIVYASKHAMATSRDYPYSYGNGDKLESQASCEVGSDGIFGVIKGSLKGNGVAYVDQDEKSLKEAVAQQPVAVAIHAYIEDFKHYVGGVLDTPDCDGDVDHAVLVVGYGTTTEGKDFWLLKNQWGDGFGEDGYIRIARNTGMQFGMCRITFQANIPTGTSCAVENCEDFEDDMFCVKDEGCFNSTLDLSGDDWLIPNSTFFALSNRGTEKTTQQDLIFTIIIPMCAFFVVLFMILFARMLFFPPAKNVQLQAALTNVASSREQGGVLPLAVSLSNKGPRGKSKAARKQRSKQTRRDSSDEALEDAPDLDQVEAALEREVTEHEEELRRNSQSSDIPRGPVESLLTFGNHSVENVTAPSEPEAANRDSGVDLDRRLHLVRSLQRGRGRSRSSPRSTNS